MTISLNEHRARVGLYYFKAFSKTKHLLFQSKSAVVEFLILAFLKCPQSITFSIFVHFFTSLNICEYNLALNDTFKKCAKISYKDLTLNPISTVVRILLILSGDIETNPGPTSNFDLDIIHVNARSIKNKIDLLEAEYNNFDVITVSETWLSDADSNDSIHMANFHPPIRLDRPNDPHGGVAIYVKNNLICRPRIDLHVNDLEAVWVETKLNQNSLLIGSFYRPPNSTVAYWELLEESLRKVNNTTSRFIILGDFNTDFLNSPSQHMLDLLSQYNLSQLVNEPTRITETSSTCIDLIIMQNPNIIKSISVLPAVCSDHSVPHLTVKTQLLKSKPLKGQYLTIIS